jgi:hypothetical protein
MQSKNVTPNERKIPVKKTAILISNDPVARQDLAIVDTFDPNEIYDIHPVTNWRSIAFALREFVEPNIDVDFVLIKIRPITESEEAAGLVDLCKYFALLDIKVIWLQTGDEYTDDHLLRNLPHFGFELEGND